MRDRVDPVTGCPDRSFVSWDDANCVEDGTVTDLLLVAAPPAANPWQLIKSYAPSGCSYYEIVPFYPDGVIGTCGQYGYKVDGIDQFSIINTGLGTGLETKWRLDDFDPDINYCI